jgi:hypothetical protein
VNSERLSERMNRGVPLTPPRGAEPSRVVRVGEVDPQLAFPGDG